jgi:hypothetical protein
MSTDDLKSRLSSPTSTNPFNKEQSAPTPSQSLNPFAPAPNEKPTSSLNPFASLEQKPTANGPASLSLNPFASLDNQPSAEASPSSATSLNPFAVQSGSASPLANAGPASLSGVKPNQSLNPFDSQANVEPQSVAPSVATGSLNPFENSANANPSVDNSSFEQSSADAFTQSSSLFGDRAAFDAEPAGSIPSAPAEDMVSESEAAQLRSLAPLTLNPSVQQPHQFELPPDLTEGLIKRSLAVSMILGAAAAAMIIGLLIGMVFDQRRAHNYRVDSWQNIDAALAKPLEDITLINNNIQEALKQPIIKWKLIEDLPKKLSAVPPTLVATRVPLQQTAVLELSKLIHEMNLLFADITDHRSLTLSSRGELEMKGQRRAFEAYGVYAVDASSFLEKCERRGRLNCKLPKPGTIPEARIVAVHSNKPDRKGRLQVVVRHEKDLLRADPSFMIPVKKDQVTGFGSTPSQAYAIRLKSIMERLESVMKTKSGFESTLKKKLSVTKVFAL